MTKGSVSGTSTYQTNVKKKCSSFKMKWLLEYVQIEEQVVKLGDIFSFSSKKDLFSKTCSKAKVANEFSEGKMWTNGNWTTSSVTFSRKVI